MTKKMLIDAAQTREVRIAITDRNYIEHFDFVTSAKSQLKGNIYLAKVTRIEPALQAAFVEYGGDKQGFLSFSEIHPDYYQIPIADRKKLLEEARLAEEMAEREEEEREKRREEQRRSGGRRRGRGGRNRDGESEDQSAEAAESHSDAMDEELSSDMPAGEENGEAHSAEDSDDFGEDASDENASDSGEEGDEDGAPRRRRGRRRGRRRPYNRRTTQEESAPKIETTSDPLEESAESSDSDNTEEKAEAPEQETAGEAAPSDLDGDLDAEGEDQDQPQAETISDGESTGEEGRKRFMRMSRRYKIQEVIKPGQIVLVQVIKEERGNKGVSLSTYISLAGRYCVLMPNSPKDGGISRKIGSFDDRQRLKDIAAELKELRGMSAIIRTAGIDRTKTEIKRDYEYLIKLWNQIRETAISSNAPALVYEEGNIIKRSIRDCYVPEIEEILVEGEEAFKEAKEFMKMIMPSHAARVKQYDDKVPLFHHEGIERHLEHLHEPVVRLRSGGYIVINPTEALISIDVNSGRQTTERNVEETAYKTNLEAAAEIARQLKLRDLGGLIVIDFIDMNYGKHRRVVERSFKDALKTDRAKIQAGHISAFGLLELSRQRLGPNIYETTTTKCPTCKGAGILRSPEALAVQLVRELQANAASGEFVELVPNVTPDMAVYLLNRYRTQLTELEQNFEVTITVKIDDSLDAGTYKLETFRRHKPKGGDDHRSGQRDRGRRGGRDNHHRPRHEEQAAPQPAPSAEATEEDQVADESASEEKSSDNGEAGPRRSRGRRGGHGRRGGRNRRRDETGGEASPAESDESAPSEEHDAIVVDADAFLPAETVEAPAEEVAAEKPKRTRRTKAEAKPTAEEKPSETDTATESEAEPDDGKPRRTGWWRKVVQS
ncbi:MAG: Rne/Rng family ribonuclease [Rickettsiales bacterium]